MSALCERLNWGRSVLSILNSIPRALYAQEPPPCDEPFFYQCPAWSMSAAIRPAQFFFLQFQVYCSSSCIVCTCTYEYLFYIILSFIGITLLELCLVNKVLMKCNFIQCMYAPAYHFLAHLTLDDCILPASLCWLCLWCYHCLCLLLLF